MICGFPEKSAYGHYRICTVSLDWSYDFAAGRSIEVTHNRRIILKGVTHNHIKDYTDKQWREGLLRLKISRPIVSTLQLEPQRLCVSSARLRIILLTVTHNLRQGYAWEVVTLRITFNVVAELRIRTGG